MMDAERTLTQLARGARHCQSLQDSRDPEIAAQARVVKHGLIQAAESYRRLLSDLAYAEEGSFPEPDAVSCAVPGFGSIGL